MTTMTPPIQPARTAPVAIQPKARLTALGIAVTHAQALLAFMFLFAAFNKLYGVNGPQLFSGSVQAFKTGLPDWAVRLTTGIVPWVEVTAGLLLLLGIWARAAAGVLSALLVVFIVLIARAIVNGYDLECGCFGKLSPFCPPKVSACNIIQNSVMLAMGLLVMLTPRDRLARVV